MIFSLLQFAAVDGTGCFLAIAGNFGLAHYTVTSRKWKVFGNIMQEKDMVVTGKLHAYYARKISNKSHEIWQIQKSVYNPIRKIRE